MKPASPSSQPNPDPKSRVVKTPTPVLRIVVLVLIFSVLLAGIFYAISHFQTDFMAARMPGIIVEKNFVPDPREEVILDTQGNMQVRRREGDFSLTVRVQQSNGEHRDFIVSNVPQAMFESVEIGQRFDVGPYLLPPSATEGPLLPTPENSATDSANDAGNSPAIPSDPTPAAPAPAPAPAEDAPPGDS